MDLNDMLVSDEPVAYQLENPTTFEPMTDAKGNPMQVLLLGTDAEAARNVEKEISKQMLDMVSKSRRGRLELSPEVSESHNRKRFMARLAGWENFVLGGKAFEYNDANKKRLYDDPKFGVIRRQIESALADESLFLQRTLSSPE